MLLRQFVFHDYPRYVPKGIIRAKYYTKSSKKIPKKLTNEIGYTCDFNKKGVLVDLSTYEPILSNAKEAGTQRFLKIAGQGLHTKGNSKKSQMDLGNYIAIKRYLKDYFKKSLKPSAIINEPIRIEFIYFTTLDDVAPTKSNIDDLDNYKQYYEKTFLDVIQEHEFTERGVVEKNPVGFILNDNVHCIKRIEHEIVISNNPNSVSNYRKLIINIYKYKSYEDTLGD